MSRRVMVGVMRRTTPPVPVPDAALIAACTEYDQISREIDRIYDRADDNDTSADDKTKPLYQALKPIQERILRLAAYYDGRLPSPCQHGRVGRSGSLDQRFHYPTDATVVALAPADEEGSISMTTRRDLLGLTAGAVAAGAVPVVGQAALAHPDAELLTIAAEAEKLEDAIYQSDRHTLLLSEEEVGRVIERSTELEMQLMAMRPQTLEGMQAKARMVRGVMQNLIVTMPGGTMETEGEFADRRAWSLCHDVLAMGRV